MAGWSVGLGPSWSEAIVSGGGAITHGIQIYNDTSLIGNRIAPGSLTVVNGNYDAVPGEHIQGKWIKGVLNTADNILVQDCHIEFGIDQYHNNGVNVIVEYCDIGQTYTTPVGTNLFVGGITVRYCDVYGGSDNLTLNGDSAHPTLIEYCYVHGLRQQSSSDHNDCAQMNDGSHTTVRGCWFDRDDVWSQTSILIIGSDIGPISAPVLVENNLFTTTGTGHPQCVIWGDEDTPYSANGLELYNNYVHEYAFSIVFNANKPPLAESGNRWWPSMDPMNFNSGTPRQF